MEGPCGMKNGKPARNEDFIMEWKAGGDNGNLGKEYKASEWRNKGDDGIESQRRNEDVMTKWKASGVIKI